MYFFHTTFRFVKQGTQLQACRISLFQDLDQITQGTSGIDDVFYDQNIFAFQR